MNIPEVRSVAPPGIAKGGYGTESVAAAKPIGYKSHIVRVPRILLTGVNGP